jgi:hypothetical protein
MAAANNVPVNQVLQGELSSKNLTLSADNSGLHIYMGGVGIQQCFILVFSFFAVKFHRTILQQARQGAEEVLKAVPLLYAVYAVLILITVRVALSIFSFANILQSCESAFDSASIRRACRAIFPTTRHTSTL